MKERIKELADQCYYINIHTDTEMFNKEKFAELIVQECMTVANSKAEGIDLDSKLYLYTKDIEDTIKKHFGVEE